MRAALRGPAPSRRARARERLHESSARRSTRSTKPPSSSASGPGRAARRPSPLGAQRGDQPLDSRPLARRCRIEEGLEELELHVEIARVAEPLGPCLDLLQDRGVALLREGASNTSSTARRRRAATRRSCRCSMSSARRTPGTCSTSSRARTGTRVAPPRRTARRNRPGPGEPLAIVTRPSRARRPGGCRRDRPRAACRAAASRLRRSARRRAAAAPGLARAGTGVRSAMTGRS